MKQVEVTILGQGYILGCPDGGEPLLHAAVEAVDREMSAIRDGGKVKARDRIAVLAALNLAYQLADRPASASTPPAGRATDDEASTEASVTLLIDRLDAALNEDGHLL